jgi:glucose-6-phosphate dehydrogenase assembly protein OpcA
MQQIPVPKTLDVEVVERHLADLWQETAGEGEDDAAVLRARVANLMVFVTEPSFLEEVNSLMLEVTNIHPSRVLTMLAEPDAPDQDIEMLVNALCQTEKRGGAKRLCGEVVVLKAQGQFTVELPSAALPLLVSDLTTFLWWRKEFRLADKVFNTLVRGSDRLVIDSDEFAAPLKDLLETNSLYGQEVYRHVGVSDFNWARLTLWRGLLAEFYDVPAYLPLLEEVDRVQIDYVAPEVDATVIAPQALLLTGWLASCLGWKFTGSRSTTDADSSSFKFSRRVDDQNGNAITVEMKRVGRGERKAGRLVQVQLQTSKRETASFSVIRAENNLHILAEAKVGADIQRGRVLPVRNRSLAQLLSREMEILTNDNLYQRALKIAVELIS